eukprot:Plantae.Rhodophyta-Hildenbrandia_rubra.ctg9789.p1 GENE.Plantae.Rhodophyta-Hildenbrandia_rubra.ctg9789~~Plantae.Rhodophyta-Hildenbrandia_rubra.ctg9789.p1  ORF type:complete len:575 (-),score=67.01 Plantae.Rhodophyta-Hildenbrandia_rubra.ctg9789:4215-5939(-)
MDHDEFHTILGRFIQRQGVRKWLFDETNARIEDCIRLEPVAVGRYFVKTPRPSDDLLREGRVDPDICQDAQPDVGDTYLFHHYDDECALGLVLGSQKFHPILPTFARFGLIEQPKPSVRHFAVDLTSDRVEFIETSRVEENLFLISIRRTWPNSNGYPLANKGEVRLYRANASLLNQFASSGLWSVVARCLALRFSIKEATWCHGPGNCRFCLAIGRLKCECAPLIRGREVERNGSDSTDHNLQVGLGQIPQRYVGNWTSWRQFLKGVQSNGRMVAEWRTVDLDGNEMMFLSNSTAYSLEIKSEQSAHQRISLFCATSGPHETPLSISRISSVPTTTSQSAAALEGALNELSTAMSLPLKTSDSTLAVLPVPDLQSIPLTHQDLAPQVLAPQVLSHQVLPAQAPALNLNETMPLFHDFSPLQRDHQPLEYSVTRPISKRSARKPRSSSGVDEEGRPVQIWTCEQCGQRIRGKKGNYNRHIAVTHRNELRFRCMYEGCGQVFGYKLNAQRHFVNKHLSRTFPCAKCQRSFKSESKRDSHVASVHDPTKESFECTTCGAAFGRKSTLNRHVKNMHS